MTRSPQFDISEILNGAFPEYLPVLYFSAVPFLLSFLFLLSFGWQLYS